MKSRVRILNAPAGTSAYTSKSAADRHVRQGSAEWVKGCLRLTSAAASHRIERKRFDLYVDRGMATVEQVQNLPVAGDAIKAFSRGGTRIALRLGRNGPVRTMLPGGRTCEETITKIG